MLHGLLWQSYSSQRQPSIKMHKRLALLLLALLCLTSCGLGSEKSVPQITALKRFPSMGKQYQLHRNEPEYAWWQPFRNSELNRLIACGLRHNPDIHIALANLEQARGELKQVKLSWIPLLNVYGGYSTNPALGVPGGFYGVWPYYALNIMELFTRQKKLQYNLAYQAAQVDGVRLVLIGQIASAYFTLLAEKEQLRLLNQLTRDVRKLITLSRKNINIGLSNDIDLDKLLVTEKLVEAQRKPVEHNIVVSQNALRFLVNLNPGQIKTAHSFPEIEFSRLKPGSLPATVLNNRPDVKMAYFAVKRDHAGIAVAYSNFFPALQLDDFIGEAHLPNSTFEQATDAYLQSTLVPGTLGLIQAKKGVYRASAAEYVKTVRRVLRDVDNDFSANKRANEQYLATLDAEKSYRHEYQLQKGLYHTGLISYKELLDSKIYLDELALTRNQAKLQLAMSLIMLYQDLGGGYAAQG
ncbi:outer membrane efflux protein [Legionella spiritensis]|nr:outer membrane efflux protein [Legionella spiritensis]